ncbi:MAG: cell envelope-related transcriptional attenuator [Candidatus Peregrinibacteria bacterium GW2011_GWF2_39_17]|nr:MAG: cell envelope-related transcriptional attenuator [Candidatus Peregrinibacteria bacterium GW2011_GWF2_39_17]
MNFQLKRIRKGLPVSKDPSKNLPPNLTTPKSAAPNKPNVTTNQNKFKKTLKSFVAHHFVWTAIILIGLIIMGKITWRVITLAEDFSVKEVILSAFSEKIKTDDENHTNILLLGTGTEDHDGANLTDTIMIASIDHDLKSVSMLSIPRDLYIKIPELPEGNRINSVFELYAEKDMYLNGTDEKTAYQKSYDVLTKTVSEILGIPIHYYARINFQAFKDIVNALDGIEINVPEDLYDPFYPAEDGSLTDITVNIKKGLQTMNGETALKYVRSRKTTSDYARAARQQLVLQAIKEKALSLGILTKPNKLKELYDTLTNNFNTNLTWAEMTYLAKISTKFDRQNVSSWILNDNPLTTGGFLYTPDRELYNGAFVLTPYTQDYSDIQAFANLVLIHPEIHATHLTYQILNGTSSNGVASEVLYYLNRFGFDVVRYGNAPEKPIATTSIIPRTSLLSGQTTENINSDKTLNYLKNNFIPASNLATNLSEKYSPSQWETQADVIIELGNDFVQWMQENKKRFY